MCNEWVSGIWGQAGAVHVSDCFRCSVSFPFDHFTVVSRTTHSSPAESSPCGRLVQTQCWLSPCLEFYEDIWWSCPHPPPTLSGLFWQMFRVPALFQKVPETSLRSDTWTWTLRCHWVQCFRSAALHLVLTVESAMFPMKSMTFESGLWRNPELWINL